MQRYKIVHVITGLSVGGAEKMLFNLITNKIYRERLEVYVISLTEDGVLGKKLRNEGIEVISLNIKYTFFSLWDGCGKMLDVFKQFEPDLIQTWLYHADLIGGFVASFYHRCPIVWGLHNSYLDPYAKLSTRLVVALCSFFSRWIPKKIISCSKFAINVHKKIGYKSEFQYIPNGFDVKKFNDNQITRWKIRKELGIGSEEKVFGMVARYDLIKDHENFLLAIEKLKKYKLHAKYLFCGNGVDWNNKNLLSIIEKCNIKSQVILLGHKENVHEIMTALDYLVVSSKSEAFPMVLGEAMLSGISCISTDVGDAAIIIGDTGEIVPAKDCEKLSEAILKMYYMPKNQKEVLSIKARTRIEEKFSLEKIIEVYISSYEKLILENVIKK